MRALIALFLMCFVWSTAYAQPITSLPAATTPLTGTEQIPLVQAGVTRRAPASAFGGITGTGVSGQCAQWTSTTALEASGSACGSGGGGGCPITVMGLTLGCTLDATMLSGMPTNGDCAKIFYDPGVLPSIAIMDAGQACANPPPPPCGSSSPSTVPCGGFPVTSAFTGHNSVSLTSGTGVEIQYIDPLNTGFSFPAGFGEGYWSCYSNAIVQNSGSTGSVNFIVTGQDLSGSGIPTPSTLIDITYGSTQTLPSGTQTYSFGPWYSQTGANPEASLGALHRVHLYANSSFTGGSVNVYGNISCQYMPYG